MLAGSTRVGIGSTSQSRQKDVEVEMKEGSGEE